jgi:citrate synthase
VGSPRIEVAEQLEEAALAELHKRKPDYVIATNVEFYSAVLLDAADVPPDLTPAMFACSRVAGLVGAHSRAEEDGAPVQAR